MVKYEPIIINLDVQMIDKSPRGFSFKYFQIAQKFITYNQYPVKKYDSLYQIHGQFSMQNEVKEELKKLGLHYVNLDLGMVEKIIEDITQEQHDLPGSLSDRYRNRRPHRNKGGLRVGENVFLQTILVAVFPSSNSAIQMR